MTEKNGIRTSQRKDANIDMGDILKGFATSGSRVVQKAASILEEEIASGIIAAKEVEEKFVNVKHIRSKKPEELLQRFRRDSHEIVDIILDLIDTTTTYSGEIAHRIITIKDKAAGPSKKLDKAAAGNIPILEVAEPVTSGSTGTVEFAFENSDNKATGTFGVACTDLISSNGKSITRRNVRIKPSRLNLKPNSVQNISISIVVSKGTSPGMYSGLLQTTGMDGLKAIVQVTVK